MKKIIVQCDICGKDITRDDVRFKFKLYENNYTNYDDFEWQKWSKLDICSVCYRHFLAFVTKEKERNE